MRKFDLTTFPLHLTIEPSPYQRFLHPTHKYHRSHKQDYITQSTLDIQSNIHPKCVTRI